MSSSSSSVCGGCPQYTFDVIITPLGGEGCGLEVTDGIIYSIGTQFISYTSEDPCLGEVTINGETPPVLVEDGDIVSVEIDIKDSCCLVDIEGPICEEFVPAFAIRKINGKSVLYVKKSVLRKLRRKILRGIRS